MTMMINSRVPNFMALAELWMHVNTFIYNLFTVSICSTSISMNDRDSSRGGDEGDDERRDEIITAVRIVAWKCTRNSFE